MTSGPGLTSEQEGNRDPQELESGYTRSCGSGGCPAGDEASHRRGGEGALTSGNQQRPFLEKNLGLAI